MSGNIECQANERQEDGHHTYSAPNAVAYNVNGGFETFVTPCFTGHQQVSRKSDYRNSEPDQINQRIVIYQAND